VTQRFTDVACPMCGCVCDDLSVETDGSRIVRVERTCQLAEPWFLNQAANKQANAWINGHASSLESAIEKAVAILVEARSPLIYGLSQSSTESQRVAVALAERLGATIDTTASTGHAPSIMALQQVGESTCTLGEAKHRADLVIYWGCDPDRTHPRHRERYAPPREGRRFIFVSESEPTIRVEDVTIRVPSRNHWESLTNLRLLVKGIEPTSSVTESLRLLARMMTECRFGVVFFGAELTVGPMAHRTVEALLQLVTELNDGRRFYARRMRRAGDVAGADSVLAWQTGYPFGVDFSRGYPRYNPGEFTGPDRLARGEADACLLIGGATANDLSPAALNHFTSIPTIVLDSPGLPPPFQPTVRIATAVYGIHRAGTAYRMDEVPIPLRSILTTALPSDRAVLDAILSGVLSTERS
jgi:formylmethanofuran dehydrogenase subunit B